MLMIIKNNKITEDINMEFDTIDFAKWDTDKLDEYSKNMDTIFQYNEDIDKTAYKFVFDLYDGNIKVESIVKYIIIR